MSKRKFRFPSCFDRLLHRFLTNRCKNRWKCHMSNFVAPGFAPNVKKPVKRPKYIYVFLGSNPENPKTVLSLLFRSRLDFQAKFRPVAAVLPIRSLHRRCPAFSGRTQQDWRRNSDRTEWNQQQEAFRRTQPEKDHFPATYSVLVLNSTHFFIMPVFIYSYYKVSLNPVLKLL